MVVLSVVLLDGVTGTLLGDGVTGIAAALCAAAPVDEEAADAEGLWGPAPSQDPRYQIVASNPKARTRNHSA